MNTSGEYPRTQEVIVPMLQRYAAPWLEVLSLVLVILFIALVIP